MSQPKESVSPIGSDRSRRGFLKTAAATAAATTVVAGAVPRVHAAEDNTIRLALIGCGGRGTGAVANALSAGGATIKLVAMADVFENRLVASHRSLQSGFADRIDVPEERRFIGFDAYRHAIDCLGPGDVVILTTPPAFRWPHFSYATERGVNVFMEKPVTVDGPTTGRMIELAKKADEKNLKVGVGLMWRHCSARRELGERIKDGELGDLIMMRAYRLHGPIGFFTAPPKPADISHLMYQIQRFHAFLWASGGCYSDFYVHNVDEICWLKGAWPVKAHATGGRHYRGDSLDQNFDTYSVEYTFADGTKFFLDGRCILGCHDEFTSNLHGTKGFGMIQSMGGGPGICRTFAGHNADRDHELWRSPAVPNPYVLEWMHLIEAIREDQKYNEVERGAIASLVTSMGRMAAHTGQVITYEQIEKCEHEFAPNVDQLTVDSPAPLAVNEAGKYPVPQPGIVRDREY